MEYYRRLAGHPFKRGGILKKKTGREERGKKLGSTGSDPDKFKYYPLAAVAVLFIGVIIMFRNFIFSDDMLYGSDTIIAGIFFRHFYVEFVRLFGSVPVWNPYIFGGLPFVDAFHGDIFYPLSILKFFGNFYRALGMNLVIHIFLAGVFMYLAARQFRLSRASATLSAAAYAFSGFLTSLVAPGHDGKIFVTALFPLTILFLDRAFEKKPALNFSLLGLVIGAIILSPHAQLSYYSLWAIGFYGLFKLILLYRQSRSAMTVARPAILLVGAVIVGLMISAIQFYPGYIYTTKYSPRADTKRGYEWATSWSMHEQEAVSLIIPEFAGSDVGEGNYYWGKNAFKDNSEYAGIIPIFLAFIGLFFARRKEAYFFGGLALFSLIYALGDTTPLFKLYYYLIPNVKSLRAPGTIMFLFLFSVSLLAGMGLQYIIDQGRELTESSRKKLYRYLTIFPGVLLFFAILFSAAGETALSMHTSLFFSDIKSQAIGQANLTKWDLAVMNLPNVQTGFWIVTVLTALSAGGLFLFLSRRAGAYALLIIPFLTMVDGIRFNSRFIKPYDYRQQFSPSPLTNYLNSLPGKFRVLNLGAVQEDYLPFFGIETVVGYHGNQLRWYDDLLGGPSLSNKGNPNFLNLVGARYILANKNAKLPPDYFGPGSLTVEKDFGGVILYKNSAALPRAFLVGQYEIIPDRKNIYPRILSGNEDLFRKAFLEEAPPIAVSSGDTILPTAEIASYANDSIAIDVQAPANCLLILIDSYYPAWEAYADGIKTPVMRANGSFRAVPVKAGTKQVVFKYNRKMNNRGKALTLAGLLIVAGVLAFEGYKKFGGRKNRGEI
jgi:hypothetical protein